MMGYVEMDIVGQSCAACQYSFSQRTNLDRIRHKNEPIRRISTLESPDRKGRPGSVEFTVGYYAKMWPNSALKTEGSDPGIPEDLKQAPEFKEARATALNDLEGN
jgi:hypothetical protein